METVTNSDKQRPKPLVFLLIDSFGVAPKHPGNIFSEVELETFLKLIKDYPVATLNSHEGDESARYRKIGANGLLLKIFLQEKINFSVITETEKVSSAYFLNNGENIEQLSDYLSVIPSLLGDRSKNPEQVIDEILDQALSSIKNNIHDVLIVNLSNLDLISAQGDMEASKKAALILDDCLNDLVKTTLKHDGVLVVASTYGRAEAMFNVGTDLINTDITDNPTPFIIIGKEYEGKTIGLADPLDHDLSLLSPAGTLADIAPTILHILNIEIPQDMSGESLI